MIITFVSCFINHHQIPLCREFVNRCDKFYFIETSPMTTERKKLGYGAAVSEYDFIVRTYDGSVSQKYVYELLRDSDVVIFGQCPNKYIDDRMSFNKKSFLYSERFFKKGVWRRFIPITRKKVVDRIIKHKDKDMSVLCASSFLTWDLNLLGFDKDKCFKWGYFPLVKDYDERPRRDNSVCRILWAGRMLPLKHAEIAIEAASKLKKKGLEFHLDFIGMGECEEELKELAKKRCVEDMVSFLGVKTPSQVIEHMEKSDVFLMTSNFREGWGAVVNEAMSTGCSVLVSSAVGSAAYLVNDGKNGLVYKYGSFSDFERKLQKLIEDKEYRDRLGLEAYKTIKHRYCAAVAVERFVEFVESGGTVSYESGPMSKAQVVKNNWYKK